jgi:hypothetical protein
MTYKLSLPSHSNIHLFFHVSCLKKVIGNNCQTQTTLPELDEEGCTWFHPQAVLYHRECRLLQETINKVLV